MDKLENWGVVISRLIADGIPYPDIEGAARGLSEWSDWYGYWADLGEDYAIRAQAALDNGRRLLAGDLFWRACLSYHYGQYMWFHDPETRERGQRRKVEFYELAAPLLDPPAERIEVPIDDLTIVAYLRMPPAADRPVPCVILLGGMESTKEEGLLFENECLRRGLATCAFDGPGQGEMFFQAKLRGDFNRFTSAVFDMLLTRAEIDPTRIGVLGRSLGGNFAIRSAAADHRLAACVVWGSRLNGSYWTKVDAITKAIYAYIAGFPQDQLDETGAYINQVLDVEPILPDVQCPVYIQHGELDKAIPVAEARAMAEGLVNAESVELEVIPGGIHCGHNRYHIARPRVADWIIGRLGGRV